MPGSRVPIPDRSAIPESRDPYQGLAERAGRDARTRTKRKRPPAPWSEPKLKPVYDLFKTGQLAAREAGETHLADSLNHLFGIWTHGRMADAEPEIHEL